jgi:hypothetical protein
VSIKTKFTLGFLIFALSSGIFVVGCKSSQQGEWRKYIANDGSYSILFPASPTEIVVPMDTPYGQVNTYHTKLDFDDFSYEVSFNDLPAALVQSTSPDSLLDWTRDFIVNSLDGNLVFEKDISLQGYPGKEIKINSESPKYPPLIATRLYLVGSRMYAIYVAPLTKREFDDNAQKFFDSFILN